MISVVIPLHNKESVVEKTLESVRKQTFTDYEVVIVNDGSTDHSLDVVSSYCTEKHFPQQVNVRLLNQPKRGG